MLGMDAHDNPCLIILVLFHLAHKVAAVYKGKSIAASVILICGALAENRKGIVLMT